ncbi:MAG TPA: dienelactone hydrolase, partial [Pseudomonas sp.]|nr:dienelactone hydrolase [Pseudomonas sp.]
MKRTLTTLVLSGLAGMAQADITVQTVLYEIDGQPYEGLLVFDEAVTT